MFRNYLVMIINNRSNNNPVRYYSLIPNLHYFMVGLFCNIDEIFLDRYRNYIAFCCCISMHVDVLYVIRFGACLVDVLMHIVVRSFLLPSCVTYNVECVVIVSSGIRCGFCVPSCLYCFFVEICKPLRDFCR